jgi:methylated-DNA-protein-cysteine methyltransferase related protein
MSKFKDKVLNIVMLIPKGKVVSYGQIATMGGVPRAARQIGWVMHSHGGITPWWRVVNNEGKNKY